MMLSTVVVVLVSVLVSVAVPQSPMGPSIVTPKQARPSAGSEYGYSQWTWKQTAHAGFGLMVVYRELEKGTVDVKNLQSNMFFGSTSHGITDDWGAYVRLGFWHRLGMEVSIIRRTAQTHNMGRMCVKGCE